MREFAETLPELCRWDSRGLHLHLGCEKRSLDINHRIFPMHRCSVHMEQMSNETPQKPIFHEKAFQTSPTKFSLLLFKVVICPLHQSRPFRNTLQVGPPAIHSSNRFFLAHSRFQDDDAGPSIVQELRCRMFKRTIGVVESQQLLFGTLQVSR